MARNNSNDDVREEDYITNMTSGGINDTFDSISEGDNIENESHPFRIYDLSLDENNDGWAEDDDVDENDFIDNESDPFENDEEVYGTVEFPSLNISFEFDKEGVITNVSQLRPPEGQDAERPQNIAWDIEAPRSRRSASFRPAKPELPSRSRVKPSVPSVTRPHSGVPRVKRWAPAASDEPSPTPVAWDVEAPRSARASGSARPDKPELPARNRAKLAVGSVERPHSGVPLVRRPPRSAGEGGEPPQLPRPPQPPCSSGREPCSAGAQGTVGGGGTSGRAAAESNARWVPIEMAPIMTTSQLERDTFLGDDDFFRSPDTFDNTSRFPDRSNTSRIGTSSFPDRPKTPSPTSHQHIMKMLLAQNPNYFEGNQDIQLPGRNRGIATGSHASRSPARPHSPDTFDNTSRFPDRSNTSSIGTSSVPDRPKTPSPTGYQQQMKMLLAQNPNYFQGTQDIQIPSRASRSPSTPHSAHSGTQPPPVRPAGTTQPPPVRPAGTTQPPPVRAPSTTRAAPHRATAQSASRHPPSYFPQTANAQQEKQTASPTNYQKRLKKFLNHTPYPFEEVMFADMPLIFDANSPPAQRQYVSGPILTPDNSSSGSGLDSNIGSPVNRSGRTPVRDPGRSQVRDRGGNAEGDYTRWFGPEHYAPIEPSRPQRGSMRPNRSSTPIRNGSESDSDTEALLELSFIARDNPTHYS